MDNIPTQQSLETQTIQKIKIFQAFKEGRLGFRDISLANENKYLAKAKKQPRPVYPVLYDTPINMRIKGSDWYQTIGIINPKTLACYKDDRAVTNYLGFKTNLDALNIKLLADKNALLIKIKEKGNRNWEVYNIATSGHLDYEGKFILPKFKNNTKKQHYQIIAESEIITTGYATEDIVCYCISKNIHENITKILTIKHSLEQTLAIQAPLPLAIYDENSGSLEICYEEEINSYLDVLAFNEQQLDQFSHVFTTPFNKIKKLINILPFTHRVKMLGTTMLNLSSAECLPKSEIVNLVLSPENYNVEKLKELLKQGGNVNFTVKQENKHISLLDQLMQSEYLRYLNDRNNPVKYQQDTIKFFALFNELALQGCSINPTSLYCIEYFDNFLKLLHNIIAFNLPMYKKFIPDLLNKSIEGDYFSIVAIHQTLTKITKKELENLSYRNYLKFATNDFNNKYQQIAMILFYYGADPTQNQYFMSGLKNDKEDIYAINCYINMWKTCKSNPLYRKWPEKLAEANKTVDKLRQELGMFDKKPIKNIQVSDGEKTLISLLIKEFDKPPAFNEIKKNDETITTILQYYYRRPSGEQLVEILANDSLLQKFNLANSSVVALLNYTNVICYIELLEKFNLAIFTEDEKTLLSLATFYIYAPATGISKQQKSKKVADYFRRDMLKHFSSNLVEIITTIITKNQDDVSAISERSSLYLEVLNSAGKIKNISCYETSCILANNKLYVSLTDEQKILFQHSLSALINGAKDLAKVTGGLSSDLCRIGFYATKYQLNINNERQQQAFEYTQSPLTQINTALDNNVRRKIAMLAGINTCTDKQHKTCNPDITNGVMYGIHSTWNDLQQINIPNCMTTLEKIQAEDDFSLLNQETLDAINTEVTRLKLTGIQMSLGALSQEVLDSDEAQAVLEKRNIKVVTEKRLRGYNHLDEPSYGEVLVPVNNSFHAV